MFQLNLSLSWKRLYRLADPLKALGLTQSFLLLSTMQNPTPTFSRITPLAWTVAGQELLHREVFWAKVTPLLPT